MSRCDSVKIRPHPKESTKDHIKPAIGKKPDTDHIAVIHTGTTMTCKTIATSSKKKRNWQVQ